MRRYSHEGHYCNISNCEQRCFGCSARGFLRFDPYLPSEGYHPKSFELGLPAVHSDKRYDYWNGLDTFECQWAASYTSDACAKPTRITASPSIPSGGGWPRE